MPFNFIHLGMFALMGSALLMGGSAIALDTFQFKNAKDRSRVYTLVIVSGLFTGASTIALVLLTLTGNR